MLKWLINISNRLSSFIGFLDFINLKVGGKNNIIEFSKKGFNRGLTFEAPRASLMASINYQVFDDILIGNFMKTT